MGITCMGGEVTTIYKLQGSTSMGMQQRVLDSDLS